ncbi:MAG: nucleotidyltransferase substrate binding protein [Proteobacteria bacterium]|nr:nucleotidyltransferase substrate binding protein [Pseudomonadota bacterium]
MDRLRQRLKLAARALATLQELAGLERPSAVERDAALQRFEYTFEAVWKASQRYLLLREGMDLGSPKACIRAARDVELFSDAETERALAMADDRNLTVHTYNEALANAIFARLPQHAAALEGWFKAMSQRLEPD